MVLDLLLSLRTGYLATVAGDPYPVCEEKLDTDIYEKFETSYWDDVSGKPLQPEPVQEACKGEVSTVREVIPRPRGDFRSPVVVRFFSKPLELSLGSQAGEVVAIDFNLDFPNGMVVSA